MYSGVSLFSGAGGLDLGLEAAGFETHVAVEYDSHCCKTIRANRPWHVIEKSIHDVPSVEILEGAGLKSGELDLLFGGPPCQPFSKSSYWVHGDSLRLEDPRASTLAAYLRVLRDLKPRSFLLENVSGIAYKNKDEGLRLLERCVNTINKESGTNYSFHWDVLQAAAYGVPQTRERFFLVGSRDGKSFEFPAPRFQPEAKIEQNTLFALEAYRTAWDAIGDLDGVEVEENLKVGGRWGDLLPSIPEGQNYLWHTNKLGGLPLFGWRRRYWSFLLKLSKKKPSWTIQAQPGSAIGPFHWRSRKLSTRELCRLQTFPDDYKILGGRSIVQKQLGNAVPSLLAEILGLEIRRQFFGDSISSLMPSLIPPVRKPVPKEEELAAVPEKYHDLIGDHSAHPGTGKGNRAKARSRKSA